MNEHDRHVRARKEILAGGTPEKRIMVVVEDKEFIEQRKQEKREEQRKALDRLEATKDARTPWFCPSCEKIMKKKIDDKMWRLYGHCFDCQVDVEHRMRLDGTYDVWEKNKIKANKKSYIDDMERMVVEWKKLTEENIQFHNQVVPDGYTIDSENWKQTEKNKEFLNNLTDNTLEYLKNMKEKL